MAALLIPVMMLGLALMTEFGNVAVGRSMGQNAADAAAKAGAYDVALGRNVVRSSAMRALADAGYTVGNGRLLAVRVEYGRWATTTRTFVPLSTDRLEANAVRVEVDLAVQTVTGSTVGFAESRHTLRSVAVRPGVALAVQDTEEIITNNQQLLAFLRQFDVPIRFIEQAELREDVLLKDEVLFISSSVNKSADTSVGNMPNPILCGEVYLFGGLGMVGGNVNQAFGNINTHSLDVEVDLYALDNHTQWREKWSEFWSRFNSTGNLRAARDSTLQITSNDPDPGRVETVKRSTDVTASHGYALRSALGPQARIISTVANRPDHVAVFWFDKGARMGTGRTAPGKRAGVFLRTAERTNSTFTYSPESYGQVSQTIRWMLFDQKPRTMVVQ